MSIACLAACSLAPLSAQPFIKIDNSDIQEIEIGISWVYEKFNKLKTKRRYKIKVFKIQILNNAINRNLIRYYRYRSFIIIDYEGLYADCFYTRYSEYKYPGDLKIDKYDLADVKKAKALEQVKERYLYKQEEYRSS